MTTCQSMSWSGVTARRMARQSLAEPSTDLGPAEVASALCGIHAQVLSAAELGIARRVAGATYMNVDRALWEERTLVKTFGPRGTIHLLSSADLPMWTGALSTPPASVPRHPDGVRFTPEQADEIIAAIGDALAEGELTVDELTEAIADRTGAWAVERTMEAFQGLWPRWRQLTSTAAHRGVLCFGPNKGRKVTYTSPQRWQPGFSPAASEEALRTLVTRYLYTYGPVTPQHFAKWLNIPAKYAGELFQRFGRQLERASVDGEAAWVIAGDTDVPTQPHRGIRLLPYFDAYVVAGQPRERLYPGPAATRALTASGQAGNYPVMLVDGIVGGVWHQRRLGGELALTVEPFRELDAFQRRQLDEELSLVGRVMRAKATATLGAIRDGAHA
jgi:hypothetical protein